MRRCSGSLQKRKSEQSRTPNNFLENEIGSNKYYKQIGKNENYQRSAWAHQKARSGYGGNIQLYPQVIGRRQGTPLPLGFEIHSQLRRFTK